MNSRLINIGAVLAIAVATHVGIMAALPHVVMRRVLAGVTTMAGGSATFHAPQPRADVRTIPLPSPDLLYSGCVLDVGHADMAVSVTPGSDYLSLSVFDMNSDNVFVTSDRESAGQKIQLLISRTPKAAAPGVQNVVLPSGRGLLLLRGLAATPEMAARTEAVRHTLRCKAEN